ncbi:Pvc16 family protein [Kitasatospora sp. NPDC049285]|uniref:Pvc16 family protein n=1 Tax=Kitasatospora sp. NPDC049285 TaxID=3157096 RepID=UPI003445DD8E
MIYETDQAIAATAKARALAGSPIGIAFDPPNRPWIQGLKGPTVNFFLFDIKENTGRRDVMFEEVRNPDGVLTGRQKPPARFDLHYTATVWAAPNVLVEHRILAAVLKCFSSLTALPRELLPPGLAELPYEVLVSVDSGHKRGMFLNLGGELKGGFEFSVTVPLAPPTVLPLAAPVRREPELRMAPVPGADRSRAVSATETAGARPAAQPQPPVPGGSTP